MCGVFHARTCIAVISQQNTRIYNRNYSRSSYDSLPLPSLVVAVGAMPRVESAGM